MSYIILFNILEKIQPVKTMFEHYQVSICRDNESGYRSFACLEAEGKISEQTFMAAAAYAYELIPQSVSHLFIDNFTFQPLMTGIPLNIESLFFEFNTNISLEFIEKIPEQVSHLRLGHIYNSSLAINDKLNLLLIALSKIPKHVKRLDLPNVMKDFNDQDLKKIFAAIPSGIENVDLRRDHGGLKEKLEDRRLKSLFACLPISVKEITVPLDFGSYYSQRVISINTFMFPNSYNELTQDKDPYSAALELLKDYTGENSDYFFAGLNLFFKGHWGRNHTSIVSSIIAKNNGTIEDLLEKLGKIQNIKSEGSLGQRIRFIKGLIVNMDKPDNAINLIRAAKNFGR